MVNTAEQCSDWSAHLGTVVHDGEGGHGVSVQGVLRCQQWHLVPTTGTVVIVGGPAGAHQVGLPLHLPIVNQSEVSIKISEISNISVYDPIISNLNERLFDLIRVLKDVDSKINEESNKVVLLNHEFSMIKQALGVE